MCFEFYCFPRMQTYPIFSICKKCYCRFKITDYRKECTIHEGTNFCNHCGVSLPSNTGCHHKKKISWLERLLG